MTRPAIPALTPDQMSQVDRIMAATPGVETFQPSCADRLPLLVSTLSGKLLARGASSPHAMRFA